MKRYHITFIDNTGNRCAAALATAVEGDVLSNTPRYNDAGHDLAILRVPDDNAEYLEDLLEAEDNVVHYRVYED